MTRSKTIWESADAPWVHSVSLGADHLQITEGLETRGLDTKKRIYCIEGVHDWGDGEVEPTVEPMLELLQRMGYWDYLHRTCGTMEELEYRLKTEWQECCEKGSVLYFCTHGGR